MDGQLPDPAAVAASLAPLGLPLETLARVPPGATPLQLAVSAGSVSAATGLVAAGARLDGAFQLLPGVAERLCSAGAGGPAVGAVAMQRLIEALMRRGMPPPFGPAEAAHQAAAELAYPEAGAPYPPLPWLIIELLSHHIHGRLAPGTHPAAYAPAMDAMLRGLYEAADGPAGSTPVRRAALEAVVMRWLGLLPAAHLGPRLWAHGEALVEAGMLGALRQLLAFPSVRQGLQASVAALPGEPAPAAAGPTRLLLAAAVSGRPEALDAVLAAGGGVSLQAVVGVLQDGSLASSERARALDLLLSRGAPHVPEGGVAGLDCCPVYAQLGCQRARQEEVCVCVCNLRDLLFFLAMLGTLRLLLLHPTPPPAYLPPPCFPVPAAGPGRERLSGAGC